ncbi:MAG TPA: phospholipase D-like domain-containing protein [Acidothermaceae bacterium]|jgi:hypothetical protein
MTKEVGRANRRPITAVIAYVGQLAEEVLPLRCGDILVCDASREAVQAGSTDAATLARFRRRGVKILSMPGLHAKFILADRSVWIGSANASRHSRDDLLEAAARFTDTTAVARVRRWVDAIVTEDAVLSAHDIGVLAHLPVRRDIPMPSKARAPALLPDRVKRLWIVETRTAVPSLGATTRAERAHREVRSRVRAAIGSSALDWIEWHGPLDGVSEGDWAIEVANGRPLRPGYVARITTVRKNVVVVWFARPRTQSRPNKDELFVSSRARSALYDGLYRVPPRRHRAVLDLYR